jgi:UMF1 family MFS transporter
MKIITSVSSGPLVLRSPLRVLQCILSQLRFLSRHLLWSPSAHLLIMVRVDLYTLNCWLIVSGDNRKRLLVAFGFTGATTSMLFLLVVPQIYLVGPVLVIIGVTCLGSSFVLLNSYLPLLVLNHPQSRVPSIALRPLSSGHGDPETDFAPFRGSSGSKSDSAELKLSAEISSKGIGIGYAAGVFVQILSILLLFLMSKTSVASTVPLRMVLFMVGVWWFVFTIPSYLWLRTRPGPPLKAASSGRSRWRSFLAYGSFAWISLWKTIKVAAKLKQMVIFLIAWFLLSDAVATISGTAILFARTELRMGTVAIALLSITATGSGIVGAFVWPMISRRFSLQTNRTIVACIVLMEIIPIYGLMGYIPFIQRWGVGGLQKAWEIYPLGFVHGFVMGGLNSYCRSFYGLLIPPGSEAAFYALYAITDKGSSAVGPAIVGAIVDRTGHIRPAFIFLSVLISLPGPLIWMVDVKRGQEDAIRMAGILKKTGSDEDQFVVDDESDFEESAGLMRDHD